MLVAREKSTAGRTPQARGARKRLIELIDAKLREAAKDYQTVMHTGVYPISAAERGAVIQAAILQARVVGEMFLAERRMEQEEHFVATAPLDEAAQQVNTASGRAERNLEKEIKDAEAEAKRLAGQIAAIAALPGGIPQSLVDTLLKAQARTEGAQEAIFDVSVYRRGRKHNNPHLKIFISPRPQKHSSPIPA